MPLVNPPAPTLVDPSAGARTGSSRRAATMHPSCACSARAQQSKTQSSTRSQAAEGGEQGLARHTSCAAKRVLGLARQLCVDTRERSSVGREADEGAVERVRCAVPPLRREARSEKRCSGSHGWCSSTSRPRERDDGAPCDVARSVLVLHARSAPPRRLALAWAPERRVRVFALLPLDRLGRLALALAQGTTADVEVQLAVVVEPEAGRHEVVDDPLRAGERSGRSADRSGTCGRRERTHLDRGVAVVGRRDVWLTDGAALDADVREDRACESSERERGSAVARSNRRVREQERAATHERRSWASESSTSCGGSC